MEKYKESESESESPMHAAEPLFRVRVCMQQFYGNDDVRARVYMCVSPRRRVRCLQRRLRRLFALPRVCLLSRGYLLPPQEPLSLLQPDDPVEVVPVDAESDNTAAALVDVMDSVDEVQVATVDAFQNSSPVNPDDLSETKRQALLMLDQYCTSTTAERAPECTAECTAERAAECTAEFAAECTAESRTRPRRRRVRRRGRVPSSSSVATPERWRQAVDDAGTDADDVPAQAAALHAPEAVSMVLRTAQQPRAPRIVRPLDDRMTATLHDTPPVVMATTKTKATGSPKTKLATIFTKSPTRKSPRKKEAESALSEEERAAIKDDTVNSKLWDECLIVCDGRGKKKFVKHVTQVFLCIICQKLAVCPVTTPCLHNFCMACIKLAFKSSGPRCPCCRHSLSKYEMEPNEQLKTALRSIMTGYDAGKK